MEDIQIDNEIYNSAINYFVHRNRNLLDKELILIKDFGPEEATCFMYKDLFILVMYEPVLYTGMSISAMTLTVYDSLLDLYYRVYTDAQEPAD